MSSIFLSHTSIDKPFVEKLASDLERLGIDPWFDKYEIKVGESIFWRVEEGLKESEYFAIVLSPEAIASEWVKSEIAAAWDKKMMVGKNAVLPILYRDCEIPSLLRSIKYADFRTDYQAGFSELAAVFGISRTDAVTEDNWRLFARKRNPRWKEFRDIEFQEFITRLCVIARKKNFSIWVGGTSRPYAVAISAKWSEPKGEYIHIREYVDMGIRMDPKNQYRYFYAQDAYSPPRHIPLKNFDTLIGATSNEAIEFVSGKMDEYTEMFGIPDSDTHYYTERFDRMRHFDTGLLMKTLIEQTDWDQGKIAWYYPRKNIE